MRAMWRRVLQPIRGPKLSHLEVAARCFAARDRRSLGYAAITGPRDRGSSENSYNGFRTVRLTDFKDAVIDAMFPVCVHIAMAKFDWDDGNHEKCSRRVPIEEIEALIEDPRTLI